MCLNNARFDENLGYILYPIRNHQGKKIMFGRIKSYIRNRETINKLESLSDRELRDIGINRYEIRHVAKTGR